MPLSTMIKVDEILTRVKINTPILYNSLVDYTILHKSGINTDYPIYITEEYNQQLHYCIQKAMNFVKFTWVIITSSNILINKKQIIENQFIKVIDKNSVALKLQTEIYKLNINYGEHKKLIYENIEREFTTWGQQDLFYKEQFNGLFLYKMYENQNVKIILKKYYYNGLFYNLFIQNKTTKKIKLGYAIKNKIKLNNTNYYIYKYHKNCVKVFNLKGINQFNCVFDNKNKLIFSSVKNYINCNIPCIISKNSITLLGKQKQQYNFAIIQDDIKSINFTQKENDYITSVNNFFNIKIKSSNKKLDMMFNNILPKKIILDEILNSKSDNSNIYSLDYNELYMLYNQKTISALQFYNALKQNILGVKECQEYFVVSPKLKYDFEISFLQYNKNVFVCYKGEEKYLDIDGIRFTNFMTIPKKQLTTSAIISLVI